MMDRETRSTVIAAFLIVAGFAAFAYFLPTIMLAAGSVSTLLAIAVAVVFLFILFVLFWLRGRSQRRREN